MTERTGRPPEAPLPSESLHESGDPTPERDVALAHYRVVMETFRHHADLYLKAFALYLAIIGTSAGLAFSDGSPERRTALMAFLAAVSSLSVAANAAVLHLGTSIEKSMADLGESLHIDPWPLGPVRALVWLVLAFSAAVTATAILVA